MSYRRPDSGADIDLRVSEASLRRHCLGAQHLPQHFDEVVSDPGVPPRAEPLQAPATEAVDQHLRRGANDGRTKPAAPNLNEGGWGQEQAEAKRGLHGLVRRSKLREAGLGEPPGAAFKGTAPNDSFCSRRRG